MPESTDMRARWLLFVWLLLVAVLLWTYRGTFGDIVQKWHSNARSRTAS